MTEKTQAPVEKYIAANGSITYCIPEDREKLILVKVLRDRRVDFSEPIFGPLGWSLQIASESGQADFENLLRIASIKLEKVDNRRQRE